jgi:hypothetical protein
MSARGLVFILLVALSASCKTWPSRPVDGGARAEAGAMDAGTDGDAAIDAGEDAGDHDAADATPSEAGAAAQEAGAADSGLSLETGSGPDA